MHAQHEAAHIVIPFSYIGTARPELCSGAVSYRKAALRHEGLRAPLYMRRNGRRQHGGARADPLERRRRIRNHAACRRSDDWRDGAFDGSDACRHHSVYTLIKRFGRRATMKQHGCRRRWPFDPRFKARNNVHQGEQ